MGIKENFFPTGVLDALLVWCQDVPGIDALVLTAFIATQPSQHIALHAVICSIDPISTTQMSCRRGRQAVPWKATLTTSFRAQHLAQARPMPSPLLAPFAVASGIHRAWRHRWTVRNGAAMMVSSCQYQVCTCKVQARAMPILDLAMFSSSAPLIAVATKAAPVGLHQHCKLVRITHLLLCAVFLCLTTPLAMPTATENCGTEQQVPCASGCEAGLSMVLMQEGNSAHYPARLRML